MGWRTFQFDPRPEIANLGIRWIALDEADPGYIDRTIFEGGLADAALRERTRVDLEEFDFYAGIISLPMVTLAGGPLEGVAAYAGVSTIARTSGGRYLLSRSIGGAGESKALSPLQSLKFWKKPETFGADRVGFRRVYQRDDLFDPTATFDGLTNVERMAKGRPPMGFDGEPVNLHHLTQSEPGSLAEVGVEPKRSFRYTQDGSTSAAEKAFNRYKYWYWQQRAKGF